MWSPKIYLCIIKYPIVTKQANCPSSYLPEHALHFNLIQPFACGDKLTFYSKKLKNLSINDRKSDLVRLASVTAYIARKRKILLIIPGAPFLCKRGDFHSRQGI
jgi:hypothetical protein